MLLRAIITGHGADTRDQCAEFCDHHHEFTVNGTKHTQDQPDIGDPEGTILRRHYFMDEDLQDAAAHMGLSKSWGSRLHARGIEKLAARLSELRDHI